MKKIIVPVDFTPESARAYEKALYIAKRLEESSISLVHVNKLSGGFFGKKPTERDEDIERNFQEFIKKSFYSHGMNIDHFIRKGHVGQEIARLADETKSYLIIMGTHGEPADSLHLVGETGFKVLAHAPCPVIMARGDASRNDIRKIVMPIDSSFSSRQKVPFTTKIAENFRAEVHVIGVSTTENEEAMMKLTSYTTQAIRYLDDANVRYTYDFLKGDDVADMTLAYAKKVNADLISVISEMETGLKSSSTLSPASKHIVNRSPISVLIVHARELGTYWY